MGGGCRVDRGCQASLVIPYVLPLKKTRHRREGTVGRRWRKEGLVLRSRVGARIRRAQLQTKADAQSGSDDEFGYIVLLVNLFLVIGLPSTEITNGISIKAVWLD
jgi:hypothetical protein